MKAYALPATPAPPDQAETERMYRGLVLQARPHDLPEWRELSYDDQITFRAFLQQIWPQGGKPTEADVLVDLMRQAAEK